MDKIILEEIQVFSRVGLLDEEQIEKQELLVSLDLYMDLEEIGKTDKIEDGLDYCIIIEETRNFAATSDFGTIESWAHHLALYLKRCFPQLVKCGITVNKPRYANTLRTKSIKVYVER